MEGCKVFCCPCGSGSRYSACCLAFIEGDDFPQTAEALLRSRYTAFSRKNLAYIAKTHHPVTRDCFDYASNKAWAARVKFTKLDILSLSSGKEGDLFGYADFQAFYEDDGKTLIHRESSTFKRLNGIWYFLSGSTGGPSWINKVVTRIGRNDLCSCGSGKKYKKCCIKL